MSAVRKRQGIFYQAICYKPLVPELLKISTFKTGGKIIVDYPFSG
jgi:hypothetical protein